MNDYQIDLLRALKMSRLQFLHEIGSLRPGLGDKYVFIVDAWYFVAIAFLSYSMNKPMSCLAFQAVFFFSTPNPVSKEFWRMARLDFDI